MNRTPQDSEALLDAAIAGVRDEVPHDRVVQDAGRRVWARILTEAGDTAPERSAAEAAVHDHIRSCDDFRALFPQYRAGTLPPARRMLVEDHIHECVACRKALHPVTAKLSPPKIVEMPTPRWRPMRWAVAAAVVIGVGLSSWYAFDKFGPAPTGNRITVLAASGPVYKLAAGRVESVAAGTAFADGDRLRTAGGANALIKLQDGSTVEVTERAELSVSATRRDTTVHLNRGQIIVQAAKRDRGHLYVASADSRVAVTGTVFSVNRGLKGSRVSVIEGSVEVRYRGNVNQLSPGDQVTTDSSMARVPVADEITWSRNYDQHLALLKQFVNLNEKLQQVRISGLRYTSRLLDAVPQGTTMYVSVPNLGRAIADVERIVKEQSAQSPELRVWLEQQFPEFEKITREMSQLGEFLGEEIVLAFQPCKGFCGILVAEVHRPGLREYIEQHAPADAKLQVVDAAQLEQAKPGMKVVLAGNRVVMGEQAALIREALAGNSKFAQQPFGGTVSKAYSRGTGLLVAVDLEKAMPHADAPAGMFSNLGIDQVRHLVAEQREVNGKTQYSAEVTFNGARRGLASWLATPGAMGSLSYVSPDAQFATSFVVKDPSQMLRDALTFSQSLNKSRVTLDEFEQLTGVRTEELAAAMGDEVTFALDGPMIPTPAWKVIFEVRNPAKVQAAIEKMIASANTRLAQHNGQRIELTKTVLPGAHLDAYTVKLAGTAIAEANYTFTEGYLVIAPSTGLLERALGNQRAGVTLARSREFQRLLPRDAQAHFSGMIYQNAGELIRLMAKGAGDATGVTAEQQTGVQAIAEKLEPTLLAIYGEEDRIELASQGSALNLLTQGMTGNLLGTKAITEQGKGTKRALRSYR